MNSGAQAGKAGGLVAVSVPHTERERSEMCAGVVFIINKEQLNLGRAFKFRFLVPTLIKYDTQ